MSLYDVVVGLQRAAEMLRSECPSFLCTQRLIQSLDETVVSCQHVDDESVALRRNCSDRARLALLATSPAVVHLADVLPVCAQLADHASRFASCVADALLGLGQQLSGCTVPTVALAMSPQQVCGLALQCCDELLRVLRSALGTQAVIVSVRGGAPRALLEAPQHRNAAGGGVSRWMHVYRVVLSVESNALLWARCSSATMASDDTDARRGGGGGGGGGPVLSIPTEALCQVLMTRELTHIAPLSLRSQLITRYVCDLLDINNDGYVDISDLCVVAPNTPLLRMMEADAAAQGRNYPRQEGAQGDDGGAADTSGAVAASECNRCEYLESQLLLAKREIVNLRSQLAASRSSTAHVSAPRSAPFSSSHKPAFVETRGFKAEPLTSTTPYKLPLYPTPHDSGEVGNSQGTSPAALVAGSGSGGTFSQFFSAGWRPHRTPQRESERLIVASHNPAPTTPPSLRPTFSGLHGGAVNESSDARRMADVDFQPDYQNDVWSEFEAMVGVASPPSGDDQDLSRTLLPDKRSSPPPNKLAARVRSLYDDDE